MTQFERSRSSITTTERAEDMSSEQRHPFASSVIHSDVVPTPPYLFAPPLTEPLDRASAPWPLGTPHEVSESLTIASPLMKLANEEVVARSSQTDALCVLPLPEAPGLPCHGTNSGGHNHHTQAGCQCVPGQDLSTSTPPSWLGCYCIPGTPHFVLAHGLLPISLPNKVRCFPTLTALSQHTHRVPPARDMRHTLFV